ncbi:MAG: hypothetical protein Q4E07_03780, partial [Eubacteriales bacterium]|nr:hypothetical protein [Eubacteriales bacterium]
IQNAISYEQRGLAMTLMQEDLNENSLVNKLKELLQKKDVLRQALCDSPLSVGTQNVLDLIEEIQR